MKAINTSLSIVTIALMVFLTNTYAYEQLSPLVNTPDAPDFLLRDMKENIYELEDYQGKPVIVNFWATWCPPCRKEMPSMNRAWKKLKNEGIEMIAINIGEDEESIKAFTNEYPIDFKILLDESGEELENWSIRGLPTTYILDPEGRIVYQAVGGREWDNDKLLDKIKALRKTAAPKSNLAKTSKSTPSKSEPPTSTNSKHKAK